MPHYYVGTPPQNMQVNMDIEISDRLELLNRHLAEKTEEVETLKNKLDEKTKEINQLTTKYKKLNKKIINLTRRTSRGNTPKPGINSLEGFK